VAQPEDPASVLQPPRPPSRGTPSVHGGRQDRLRVRILPDELRRWRAAARASGAKSLSGWLRAVADEAAVAERDPVEWRRDLAELVRTLRSGVGNDINQVSRRVNAAAKAGRLEDLAPHMESLAVMSAEVDRVVGLAEKLLAPRRKRRRK
jgi:hypothetical protein